MKNEENQSLMNSERLLDIDNNILNTKEKNYKKNISTEYEQFVDKYDEMCEEHSKIIKIESLSYSEIKIFFLIVCSILTCFLIDLLIIWFPKLKRYFIYKNVPLKEAKFIGIYGTDNSIIIASLEKIKLPNIKNSNLLSEYESNIPYNYENEEFLLFTYKLFKYIFNPITGNFSSLTQKLQTTFSNIHLKLSLGLNNNEIEYQKKLHGKCDLEIEIKSFIHILAKELTDPFYIFQICSVILWIFNDYNAYACVIIAATTSSLLISTYETRKNLLDIQKMAKYECNVKVYRRDSNNNLINNIISSTNLVPGDIFEIQKENLPMPCDCILINGNAIINESMLTGESTPIVKTQIQKINCDFNAKEQNNNFLYAGTKLIQKRTLNNNKVLCLVYSTGFSTIKGSLIRSILYPKKFDFKFKQDSIKYICIMAFLSVFGFTISLPFLKKAGIPKKEIILKSLDLFTTTVPPALPACLGIGISYAINRLKNYGIICINRDRVNIAGKVNICVFDKTGTLTEDHLDIFGYRNVKKDNKGNFIFGDFIKDAKKNGEEAFIYYKENLYNNNRNFNDDLNKAFVECLASCHSATFVNGELIGDPIDVQMFKSCNWEIFENNNEKEENSNKLISTFLRPKQELDLDIKLNSLSNKKDEEDNIINDHYELGVVRRFDFSSKLQRMSVIVKNVNENYYKIFCKGSPEKIIELCKEETIPDNFNEILTNYTSKGFRVLALSFKLMKMNYIQSQEIIRDKVENNMIFLGLLIVQNKLKEETKNSIELLSKAGLKMVMATGDNILTAISVGRECNLINNTSNILTCEIENKQLIWNYIESFNDNISERFSTESNLLKEINIDDNNNLLLYYPPENYSNKYSKQISISQNENLEEKKSINKESENSSFSLNINNPFKENLKKIPIAINGKTFEKLYNYNNEYKISLNPSYKKYNNLFRKILQYCKIYARMSPEQKSLLIQSYKNEKLTVLMCGDGANDCSALRNADIGVSLSPEEASIAAPFTSNISNISCLEKLLREGKSSLITSIQTFKYMMVYSLIQFIAITLLMIYNSYLSDYQFLAVDLFIIFPLAFFIPMTEAYDKLTKDKVIDSLTSLPIISSILLQMSISFIFQYLPLLILTKGIKWYVKICNINDDIVKTCPDNTLLFLISNMQYLISAVSFTISKPFKKDFYTNFLFTGFVFLAFIYSVYIIIIPDKYSRKLLQIYNFKKNNDGIRSNFFTVFILIVSLVNFIVSLSIEKIIIPFITEIWEKNNKKHLIEKSQNPNIELNLLELQILEEEEEDKSHNINV